MKRNLGIAALVAALLALATWWWRDHFEWAPLDVERPLRGEARYNAFFALRKALEEQGREVTARGALDSGLDALGDGDLVVLGADVRTLGQRQVDDLLAYLERGGRLVFDVPGGDDERGGPLLEALDLTTTARAECLELRVDADAAKNAPCVRARHFRLGDDAREALEWQLGDDEDPAFARGTHGDGAWLAAGSLAFLKNDELDDHAAFAWQVLAPMLGDGRVHLVYATDVPPLHVLLLRHGWTVVVPLALALLAWLWSRTGRLGPVLPVASTRRRALLEHVNAAGELAYRRGRVQALHAAVRRAVLAHLHRSDPALAALEPESIAQALASRHALPVEAVREALATQVPPTPQHFVATIRTLMTIKGKS
jgi:hypothetical protein